MKKIKVFLIIFIINFLFLSNSILNASSNFYIVAKVDNEIITNVDIINEINYLTALNNDLKNIDKNSLVNLAKNSLIREKIKKNEINKNSSNKVDDKILRNLIENYYKRINLKNLNEFEKYLSTYNISLNDVKQKIKIEILWNQIVYFKYNNLLNINIEELKNKVDKNKNKNNEVTKYLLSEILFSINSEESFEKKDNEIKKKIMENGFKTAANIYSISSTAKFGGRIGLMNEKQLSPKILKEIKQIKVGEITNTLDVPSGFLILKLEDKIVEKFEKDLTKELENLIRFETDRQLNQFSIIYFNKLKLNSKITYE
tara:strand:+ start:5595 stop:6539 length:945 start_codon:yes stop_codon:yes gene_type:complete